MKTLLLVAILALPACQTVIIDTPPPIIRCEGLPEFGCDDSSPKP